MLICHVGVQVTCDLLHRLMDGVDPGDLEAARAAACAVNGVHSADVRGRWMGRNLAFEVETCLDDGLNLADADRINTHVEDVVRAAALYLCARTRTPSRPRSPSPARMRSA